jgi:hypothetical protein
MSPRIIHLPLCGGVVEINAYPWRLDPDWR